MEQGITPAVCYDRPVSVQVQLVGVEETLLIPLWARAAETERPQGLFRDPRAVTLRDRIAYDFHRFDGDAATQAGIAVRTRVLDEAVEAFLAAHPGAVVLNLAAGLDTRYFRVGAAASRWYEVDLPNVMKLRRQLFTPDDRHRFLTGSVLEPAWAEAVEIPEGSAVLVLVEGLMMYLSTADVTAMLGILARTFPGATALLEVFGRLASITTLWASSVSRTHARFQGGFDNPTELTRLAPTAQVTHVWHLLDAYPARWGWRGFIRWLPIVGTQYKIVQLEFTC